jgi:hypothetical protein
MFEKEYLDLAQTVLKDNPTLDTDEIQKDLAQYLKDTVEDYIQDLENENEGIFDEDDENEETKTP